MRHLRQLLGRSGWPQAEKRRNTKKPQGGRKRRLQSETLERRELLAGDVLASSYHNASMPTDVNQDSQITPLDALMVINYLSQKNGAQGERITGFVDVNGDGEITPSDALMVINELSRMGEAAPDPVIELMLNPKSPTGLGSSNLNLPDPENDRIYDVSVGQVFELEVSYQDLRDANAEAGQNADRRGVFQLVTDILASQGNNVVPIVHEAQQILIGESIGATLGNGETLSLELTLTDADGNTIPERDESGNIVIDPILFTPVPVKASISAADFVADPALALRNAMESLSDPLDGAYFPSNSFDVSVLDEVNAVYGVEGDYFLQVRGKGDALISKDIPNVILSPQRTTSEGGVFPANTVKKFSRQFNVTNGIPLPPATPNYALDFSSSNKNGAPFFANSGVQGTFNPGDAVLFDELRGLGGTAFVPVNQLNRPFDSYSIPVFISSEVTGLDFSVRPGQDPEAVLVYGFLDPGSSQDGLVAASTTFGTTTKIRVVADQVGESQNGVKIMFNGNGPTNAAPTANFNGTDKIITVTYDSGATNVANRSYTAIANAINGLADFNASVNEGDGAAAFVKPAADPELAGGGEPKSIVPLDRIVLDVDSKFKINAKPVGGTVQVPGTLGFQAATAVVDEDAGTVTLTVERTGGSDGEVTIDYATADGSATSGSDYVPTNGKLTFADGVTSQTITINIVDDSLPEPDETFTVTLSSPGGGATLGTAVATVTIRDDDDPIVTQPGTISLAAATISVDEGAGTASFVINRTDGSDGTVTVTFATADGTATHPEDYTEVNTTVTFLDGETTKTVTVPIVDDTIVEGDETFMVMLTAPTGGATLGTITSATATIIDNDVVEQPGSFTITPVTVSVDEGAGSQEFIVTRSGGSDGAVTVAYATADGTAVAPGDYTATSGTLTFATGETTKTFSVPIIDDSEVESDETFTVTLSNPTNGATLGATIKSTVTIIDNDTVVAKPGSLSISQPTVSVGEGDGTVTFTINRAGGSDGTVTVNYATADGTATAGSDYTPASGTLTFAEGETSKQVVVTILEDAIVEPNETFTLTISNPTGGATLGTVITSTATIVDNDTAQPGKLSISQPTISVGEGDGTVTFTINRSGGSDGTVTVAYATADGTATAGSDYTAASGTLTFAEGETSKQVVVTILEDTIVEPNETFILTISSPTGGATLGTVTTSTVTIIDNDEPVVVKPGVISISPATKSVDESGGSVSFTITRTDGSDGAVSVKFATSDGSATAGSDYTAKTGTVNFADGEVSKTITINILDDAIDEPNETFLITLSGPTGGATLGDVRVATVTIIDNDEPPIGSSTVSGSIFIDSVNNMDEVSEGYPNVTPERDGVRNALPGQDESGLSGVKVELINSSGVVVKSAWTNMEGEYAFTGVTQGTYTLRFGVSSDNVFLSGSNIVPVNVGSTSSTVPGNLAVLGRAGALASLDILASSYLRNNPDASGSSEGGRRGGSVALDATGAQIFLMAAEGFDSVEYAEVRLNSTRDQAILAIVDNGQVLSAVLADDEYVISRDGTALQFFGGYDDGDDFGFAPGSGIDGLSSADIAEILARAATSSLAGV